MWEESKHPRDAIGRFTDGTGSGRNRDFNRKNKQRDAIRRYSDDPGSDMASVGLSHTGDSFRKVKPTEFRKCITAAKDSIPEERRWRVDVHDEADYAKDKLFVTPGGSCVAVEPDGNIISVCKNLNSREKGVAKMLLEKAVSEGGDRLDAFGRQLFGVYTQNGFEPVSWTPFNEEYAPDGWKKGRDDPESVIFYKFTGKQLKKDYESFLLNTPASLDYDDAKNIRNKE